MQDTGTINIKKLGQIPEEIAKYHMTSKTYLIKEQIDKKRIEKANLILKKDKIIKKLNFTRNKKKKIKIANETMKVHIHDEKLVLDNHRKNYHS